MFCLVSRQAMANVLPVLMCRPDKALLFVTLEEKNCADHIETLFSLKGIIIERVDNLNAYDYSSFKKIIKSYLEKYCSEEVVLNVTGGTKLMALAAYNAFTEMNKKILYCDTENQELITLSPNISHDKLAAELSIEDYLISYGYTITEKKDTEKIELYYPLFDSITTPNRFNEFILFQRLIRLNLVRNPSQFTIESKNKRFRFSKSHDSYFYFFGKNFSGRIRLHASDFKAGDWLEYFTYHHLTKKMNLPVFCGVKIISNDKNMNEIDLVSIKNYKLILISCKSGNSNSQYDLYQLETLRNITSGTFGKGIFISSKSTEALRNRARELKIEFISPGNLGTTEL